MHPRKIQTPEKWILLLVTAIPFITTWMNGVLYYLLNNALIRPCFSKAIFINKVLLYVGKTRNNSTRLNSLSAQQIVALTFEKYTF